MLPITFSRLGILTWCGFVVGPPVRVAGGRFFRVTLAAVPKNKKNSSVGTRIAFGSFAAFWRPAAAPRAWWCAVDIAAPLIN